MRVAYRNNYNFQIIIIIVLIVTCTLSLFTELSVNAAVSYPKYTTPDKDRPNLASLFNYASEFLYTTHDIVSVVNKITLVHNGMIILKNASQSDLGRN